MTAGFEAMLTGGHPNSLGRTLDVVDMVLNDPPRLEELFACYQSADAVVRLRTSSAIKRVTQAHPEWVVSYIDLLIEEIGALDQASAQWTLAILFDLLRSRMNAQQQMAALDILKRNLAEHYDWIVLTTTLGVLTDWAKTDPDLKSWLLPHATRLSHDPRKAVSGKAKKMLKVLTA